GGRDFLPRHRQGGAQGTGTRERNAQGLYPRYSADCHALIVSGPCRQDRRAGFLPGPMRLGELRMDNIWLRHSPAGVPAAINPDGFPSVPAMLAHIPRRFGNRPAYSSFGKTLSHADVDLLSGHFAAYLHGELKLARGTRVAL